MRRVRPLAARHKRRLHVEIRRRVCRHVGLDITEAVVIVALLAVPGTAVLLIGLLALSAVVEARILCPRSLIMRVARGGSTSAEYTEAFVAREFERLLRTSPR